MIEETLLMSDIKHIKSLSTLHAEFESSSKIAISVDCVIFGFDENKLKILLIRSDAKSLWANGRF